MTIQVTRVLAGGAETKIFADAAKWHIDECNNLHVIGSAGKHLAAYRNTEWSSINFMLTENQVAAESIILDEIHTAFDTAGIDGEDFPDLALTLLGSILSKLIESGHLTA